MESLSIGQLARSAGLHVETIRFYERRGLLPAPPRSRSGYRRYSPDDRWRLAFIRRAQGFGFTLAEIAAPLELVTAAPGSTEQVRARAQVKLAVLDEQLARLRRTRELLLELVAACSQDQTSADCLCLDVGGTDEDERSGHGRRAHP